MAGNYTICVGTIGSGLWLSPDGGDSWQRVRDGLPNESRVFGLTVHPTEPRTVFAGADDGLYQSRDGGQSFARLDSPMNASDVWRIAIDPTNPDIIFAGTRPAALFRSTDGGRNWQKLPADIVEECPNVGVPRVTALTVDPSDPRRLGRHRGRRRAPQHRRRRQLEPHHQRHLRSRHPRHRGHGQRRHHVLTSTPGEIFASHDRGESWQGLGVRDQFSLRYCRRLAQKADDPETLFVATGNGAVGDAGAIQRSNERRQELGGADPCRTSRTRRSGPSRRIPPTPAWIIACSHYGELYATRERRRFVAEIAPRIHRNPRPLLGSELTARGAPGPDRSARTLQGKYDPLR